MKINRDFQEFLKLLAANEVQYLLVGAFVRAYYGKPRYAEDLDLFIKVSEDNATKLIRTLSDAGFSNTDFIINDFIEPDSTIHLRHEPLKIDIFTGITGVTFDNAWKNREIAEIDGITVNILHRDDYIKNKKALGTQKDLADIDEIKESLININKD